MSLRSWWKRLPHPIRNTTHFLLQREIEAAADWWTQWLIDAVEGNGTPKYELNETRLFREALLGLMRADYVAGSSSKITVTHQYDPYRLLRAALTMLELYESDPFQKVRGVFPADCSTVIYEGAVMVRTSHYGEAFNLLTEGDLADRTKNPI